MTPDLLTIAESPAAYRNALLIPSAAGGVARLADVMAPYQRRDFEATDGGFLRCMGRHTDAGFSRAWIERCRSGSKTSDLAIMAGFPLAFCRHEIRGIAVAADADQARLIKNAFKRDLDYNPWLAPLLETQQNRIFNPRTGSELTIISSDTASSWGHLIDFCLIDELAVWEAGSGEELWASVVSAVAKKPHAMLLCAGNSGWLGTWQFRVREQVRQDPAWHFSAMTKPPPWVRPKDIEEQRRLLPAAVFARVWEGVWTAGTTDALDEATIMAAVVEENGLSGSEEDWQFFAGIDLGIARDHSSVCVVGKNRTTRRYRLARTWRWVPRNGQKVDLISVRDTIVQIHQAYNPRWFADPWQLELLAQELQRIGIYLELVPFSGTALSEMASSVIETLNDRIFTMHRDEGLINDLRQLRLKESPPGFRLDAARTATSGHADAATALALSLLGGRRQGTSYVEVPDAQLMEEADRDLGIISGERGWRSRSPRGYFNPMPSGSGDSWEADEAAWERERGWDPRTGS